MTYIKFMHLSLCIWSEFVGTYKSLNAELLCKLRSLIKRERIEFESIVREIPTKLHDVYNNDFEFQESIIPHALDIFIYLSQ